MGILVNLCVGRDSKSYSIQHRAGAYLKTPLRWRTLPIFSCTRPWRMRTLHLLHSVHRVRQPFIRFSIMPAFGWIHAPLFRMYPEARADIFVERRLSQAGVFT